MDSEFYATTIELIHSIPAPLPVLLPRRRAPSKWTMNFPIDPT